METHLPQLQIYPSPKSTTEIIKEIKRLEVEVKHLEEYLLLLYRKAFDHQLALSSSKMKVDEQKKRDCLKMPQDHAKSNAPPRKDIEVHGQQGIILDSSIRRTHSSLSHHSNYSIQSPPLAGKAAEAMYSYHSVPITLLERGSGETEDSVISMGDQVRETANWVSEEMVKCISAIYCQLSETSVIRSPDFSSPEVSFESSMGGLVGHGESNLWSPPPRINASFDLDSDVTFHSVGYEEFSGLHSQTVEILKICRESDKLREIEPSLQKFRSFVNKLEGLNPCKLKHEEKLAFWINVHNALVMHAFLVHGVPHIKTKRISLLLKAAYNIGGNTISVDMIQNYILGCRLPHPGQWFHRLFSPKKKFRTGAERKSFALDCPEPLSYFALSCGNHSDPPVQVYTPTRVFQDLIAARAEYILNNYTFHKEQNKIILPKILDIYAKDARMHPADFIEIIEQILPEDHHRNRTRKSCKKRGNTAWIPHDFSFRYQLSRDLFH